MNCKAYQDLLSFENDADKKIQTLSIFNIPLRSIISKYFHVAENSFRGGYIDIELRDPEPDKGETILSRISYLRPFYKNCKSEVGSNLENAYSVLGKSQIDESRIALSYAHFCEIMPFVHRGTYVAETLEDGFRLRFASDEHARYEMLDIIASDLALTAIEKNARLPVSTLLRMVGEWPMLKDADVAAILQSGFDHHLQNIREQHYIRRESYKRALGFEREEFVRIRAALMALASWCIGMSLAAEALAFEADEPEKSKFHWENMEWSAPLLTKDFILTVIHTLTGLSAECIGNVLQYFMETPLSDGPQVSGDGYQTPLIAIKDMILFSPRAILSMTPERNILYALNKIDRKRFDKLVSAELEPALLEHAKTILEELPQINVLNNVEWTDGEIDLIVYSPMTNTALQLQAKAAIPPQGARMTRQIEDNTIKAVKQLEKFEQLTSVERDDILSHALRKRVKDVVWSSGVLSRSSFGTANAWECINSRGAFNLTTLSYTIDFAANQREIDVTKFAKISNDFLKKIASLASGAWEEAYLDLFDKRIYFPNLNINNKIIGAIRSQLEK